MYGDLWKYQSSNRAWIRVTGLAAPSGRSYAATWMDAAGTLWLFGGRAVLAGGASVLLDDLWRFEPPSGVWTRITGASQPGPSARMSAASWLDSSGNLWLFGGYGEMAAGGPSQLNDLWRYSPAANSWEQQSVSTSQ
jgi:N-acetylneuraminic acid mutarotase